MTTVVDKSSARADAQEAANFEEVPAWAAGLMQSVKDMATRIDEIDTRTKGGTPKPTAVAQDVGAKEAEASADDGPRAGKEFEAVEHAESKGAPGEKEADKPAGGPESGKKDPKLEGGIDRMNTEGEPRADAKREDKRDAKREDERAHEKDAKDGTHAKDRMDAMVSKTQAQFKEMQTMMQRVMRQPTVAERNAIAAARSRADSVYGALGRDMPEWLPGESPGAYRRRLAEGLKDHSEALKKTVMDSLPDDVFGVAEEKVYADALAASRRPEANPPMQLRARKYQDANTGHNITEYHGDPMAWMEPFMLKGAKLKVRRPSELAAQR